MSLPRTPAACLPPPPHGWAGPSSSRVRTPRPPAVCGHLSLTLKNRGRLLGVGSAHLAERERSQGLALGFSSPSCWHDPITGCWEGLPIHRARPGHSGMFQDASQSRPREAGRTGPGHLGTWAFSFSLQGNVFLQRESECGVRPPPRGGQRHQASPAPFSRLVRLALCPVPEHAVFPVSGPPHMLFPFPLLAPRTPLHLCGHLLREACQISRLPWAPRLSALSQTGLGALPVVGDTSSPCHHPGLQGPDPEPWNVCVLRPRQIHAAWV